MARAIETFHASLSVMARTLRQAAPVLAADPSQLAGQLLARLHEGSDADLRARFDAARQEGVGVWLRPLTASLNATGGADLLSLPAGWEARVDFVEHEGRGLLALGDHAGFALWDIETGEHVADLPPPDGGYPEPERAACGRLGDGVVVLTTDRDRSTLSAWMPDAGMPLWECSPWIDPAREDPLVLIRSLAIGGDPVDPVAAVCMWHREENVTRIWLVGAGTGAVRRTIDLERGGPEVMALAAVRGGTLLAGDVPEGVAVWDCASGERVRTVPAGGRTWGAAPVALGAVGGGWVVATAHAEDGEDGVAVWDGDTGERIAFLPLGRGLAGLALAGGGGDGLLAIGHADWLSHEGGVRVWDAGTRGEVAALALTSERTASVAIRTAPRPRLLATATDDSARVWDLDRVLAGASPTPAHGGEVTAVAFGPAAASGDRNGVVWTWTDAGRPAERVVLPRPVLGLAWCELGGAEVLAVATDGELVVVDPASGRTVRQIPVSGTVEEGALAAVDAGGDWCLAVETSRLVTPDRIAEWDPDAELGQPVNVHQVQVFALATGDLRYELEHRGTPMAWRADEGARFVLLGRYGAGETVDARSGEPVGRPTSGLDPAGSAVKAAAARHALGEAGEPLGAVRAELAAPLGPGRVATSWGRQVRIWNLTDPRPLAAFTSDDRVTCFAVRRDGRRLALGDRSGAVHHLDLAGP